MLLAALTTRLVRQGVLPPGETLDGPWPGAVQSVEVSSGTVPSSLEARSVSIMLSQTRLILAPLRAGAWGVPLHRIVAAERSGDRDIALLISEGLQQSLFVVWRPTRSERLGDPGRELWARWDTSLAAMDEQETFAHALLAGVALHWRGLVQRAGAQWSQAVQAPDPLVAGLAAVGLADLCEGRGDRDTAEQWYRRVVQSAPDAPEGSSLRALVTSAEAHLARLAT